MEVKLELEMKGYKGDEEKDRADEIMRKGKRTRTRKRARRRLLCACVCMKARARGHRGQPTPAAKLD